MSENKKIRCVFLLSGGLDSTLAAKILMEQGVEVELVNFTTSFCGPRKARQAAVQLGLPLREINIKKNFVEVLKKPKHGYGAGMNPCIDCHGLMLKKAKQIMREEGFDFVATGEVLNERPMSQTKKSLKIVEKDSGLEGYLLRPLSAKALEETIPEKDGRVDRNKLLNIVGRSRREQMVLAEKYGIKDYPTPAGGCALTQAGFAGRVKDLFDNNPACSLEDIELLKFGRQFWVNGVRMIVGRNEKDNMRLESLLGDNDILIKPKEIAGPSVFLRAEKIDDDSIKKATQTMTGYMKKIINQKSFMAVLIKNGESKEMEVMIK